MLDDESTSLRVQDPSLHDTRSKNSLLRIEIGRWLINKINVTRFSEGKDNSHSLKLTTRQCLNFIVQQFFNVERDEDLSLEDG